MTSQVVNGLTSPLNVLFIFCLDNGTTEPDKLPCHCLYCTNSTLTLSTTAMYICYYYNLISKVR